jgi:hypothetical protein
MKKITMRLIALALLTLVSMGAAAKIDVQIAKFDGGTIEVTGQEEQKDGGVKVTITVSPNSGYTIKKDAIEVYATYPPSGSRADTRDIEIASSLTLSYNGSEKEDVKDASAKRDYTFIVPSGFGAWVKDAKFQPNGSKGGSEPTRSTTGYSGTYYIASLGYNAANSTTNYYLCPTEEWAFYVADGTGSGTVTGDDNGKPFLTTYQCRKGEGYDATKAVWIIEKAPEPNSDYYYIKQKLTGRYLVSNGAICSNPDRARVHLEEINDANDLDDKALFSIYIPNNKSYFVIKPKGITDGESSAHKSHEDHKWLSVNQGNKNDLAGTKDRKDGPSGFENTGGIICIYTEADANAPFYLEIPSPVISRDPSSLKISISCEFDDVIIRYTTDGKEPTKDSTPYEGEFLPGIGTSAVKAKAFNSSGVASASTTFELPKNAAPSISVNMSTMQATISTSVEGGTIYYTTNGSNPTVSSSVYSAPITFNKPTIIKAIVGMVGYAPSTVTIKDIIKVEKPQFYDNGNLAIVITSSTVGASIYYTTDGTTPSKSSSQYTAPLTDMEGKTIKAIALKKDCFDSDIETFGPVSFSCAQPLIRRTGLNQFTLTCSHPTSGVTIYYTTNGDTPSTSDSHVGSGETVSFEASQLPLIVKAIAVAEGYSNSPEATLTILDGEMSGSGTSSDPYQIAIDSDFPRFVTKVNGTEASASFIVTNDINASGATEITTPFTGTFDGGCYTISDLGHALFNSVSGGTVKNVILDNVGISGGTNAGAIANKVTGTSNNIGSVYNCGVLSGSVGGSGYVGSIVGQLGDSSNDNCYARVINCFSYATVNGGSDVGGIVGYNDFASTAGNIRTMVMNCMFYGDIKSGTNVSPVYGGDNINNLQGGLNNFNYYAYSQLKTATINKYNCALAVEDNYLNRFEFYRLLLNSNKKLAAFYATGSPNNAGQMAKWVLETADRTINDPKPYPVLKAQGFYPSIINPDFTNAPDSATVGRNKGGKLGKTLSVTISGVGSNAPGGASITKSSLTLQRTDKDPDRFNFNYDKVQLPYYNDVGTGNYTGNKVVTGWKITAITPVEGDPYTSANYPATGVTDFPNHNYADRKSSNKDLYSVSKRVFSQGAYFDVPYGVTSITIEPYWGNAIYIADQYYDVVYKNDYTGKQGVIQTGTQITTFNGQSVKNSITDLSSGATVYDNAVVLVGNFHLDKVPSGGTTPFTMMSVDEDKDNEPDYSLIYHHKSRTAICPIRFDFLNIPGTAQAQKPNGASLICNFTIFKTKGWFEVTNTSSFYSSQLEYENQQDVTKSDAPLILLGGVIDQFVSTQSSAVDGHTIYIHVGGNVWINEFGMGTHSDGSQSTPHVPVSVTGGEYEGFYLTGTYNQDATVRTDNAECYISGGHFVEAAGASQEAINGNVRWQIYNADIDNFFGGGTNDAKPIAGDVTVDIYNSNVTLYCGGPKFGNMQTGKKVTTNAEGCTFGKYFGAGYGGTAYSRKKYYDESTTNWNSWDDNYISDRGKFFDGKTTNAVQSKYGKKGIGVATDFDYEFFVWSTGQTGGRFFVKFASFSLAQCNDVESNLKGCTVNENFYGGGSLGSVVGTAKSVLEDCTVQGNVFGGGYSATLPTVQVRDGGFTTQIPNFNASSGMFEPAILSGTTEFEWKNASEAEVTLSNGNSGSDLTKHYLYTNTDLSALGQVAKTDLTIKGNTVVRGIVDGNVVGGVFGGGDESKTTETTTVDIQAGSVSRVFGGGNKAAIGGNTTVQINGGSIVKDVYGGGKEGDVGGNATLTVKGGVVGTAAEKGSVHGGGYGEQTHVSGNVEVNIGTRTGAGTQQDPHQYAGSAEIYGDVYGGSAFGTVNSGLTNSTNVNLFQGVIHGDAYGGGLGQIGREAQDAVGTEGQEGYQPAVTEIKAIAAQVKGVVNVTLDGAQFDITEGEDDLIPANKIAVSGRIFGCNNLNGSPEGDVNVSILRTVGYGAHQRTALENLNNEETAHSYELAAVYGGGNLAAYLPYNYENNLTAKAHIIINGCDNVSIRQVYGGGNAASTPAAQIDVNGTYEIEELFGGGNGKDRIQKNGKWYANPGANMGFLEYADGAENAQTPTDRATNYGYGKGETNVNIYGGRIHRVFGGANTKGNVRIIALTILEDENQCTFMVDEAYGGGKSASMDGAAELKMACIPGLKAAYGGAQEADINNDVTLNITNGTFDRVFGGNNKSGHITGTITVNIEETGCKPVIIGQVYGGGNLAPYTAPSGKPGPTVNVKSFTSIGEVYGGGFGAPATVTGDTHVNINEVILSNTDTGQTTDYSKQGFTVTDAIRQAVTSATLYPRPADTTNGSIGVIGNIYGGGNEAQVIGNTYVNIGNLQEVEINTLPKVNETTYQTKTVKGADIRGNVYGGGNKAEVTGSTNVVVGKQSN